MIVRIKLPAEKILPHCWPQVNTHCSPDFSMSKAGHGGQAYPRIYLFQCFSPSPVSTTFFHKAPYLFYHHPCPSARFERTLPPFHNNKQGSVFSFTVRIITVFSRKYHSFSLTTEILPFLCCHLLTPYSR